MVEMFRKILPVISGTIFFLNFTSYKRRDQYVKCPSERNHTSNPQRCRRPESRLRNNHVSWILPGMGSRQFCRGRGRGRGREVEAEARQGRGRGRELEAEARQTKFEARPRRGDPLEKPSFPRCIAVPHLVALSQTV